jgi:superfamily I DNA and/or RNA helicase
MYSYSTSRKIQSVYQLRNPMAEHNRNKNRHNHRNNNFQAGDKLFYSALHNEKVAEAIRMTTKSALKPYYNFINEAIKAENKKGSYEVDWKYIESNYSLIITPIYCKFKVEKPETIFKVFLPKNLELKKERNKLFFDSQDEIVRFDKSDIDLQNDVLLLSAERLPQAKEILELNNEEVKYELSDVELKIGDVLSSNNEKFKIEKLEQLESGWNVIIKTNKNTKEVQFNKTVLKVSKYQSNIEKLFDDGSEYKYEKLGNEYQCKNLPKSKTLKDEEGNEYTWRPLKNKSKSDIVIQLIDDDSNDEKSISEYFFEDDVRSIYQGKDSRNSFDIKKKKNEDKILILKQDWENPKELNPEEKIKIKVDTANLKKQQNSVRLLNSTPIKAQKKLLKLFERQNQNLWKTSNNENIDDWYILNNEDYDGTLDQRKFVEKAIATDDFALLEGPPGSGKTTTILELILQLIKKGKKILLSASTHVAIDNVLERIEQFDKDKLVEPLRIGRSDSVGEAIQHLQIDEKLKAYKNKGISDDLASNLILDSANLICGTTMGINQFPPIKNRGNNSKSPLDTMFDYMIIDESSKTTFQEFLVPAMLAEKWILVGDIKQLSPFIEQSHIVHNFNVMVPHDVQKAIRLVFETLNNNKNPYIVEVSTGIENEIKKYLEAWSEKDNNPYKNKVISYSNEEDLFKVLGSDLILFKENTWEQRKDHLPKTHILISNNVLDNDNFYFKQNYLNKKRKLKRFDKINRENSKTNSPIEYKDIFKNMLKEKNWAEEIAWRMIRVYERRMLKNPNSYYEKTYELLKPIGEGNAVERVYNMTLPSILESIQVGNGEKHRYTTTITDGFDKRDLYQRHETLKTQHRMAPDISKFSRENFYTVDGIVALKDATTIDREWSYDRYDSRAVWLDTPKSVQEKRDDRRHKKEVDIIITEIKAFIEFAKSSPLNNDKEPWTVAILTFYKPQETLLRKSLREFCDQPNKMSRFNKGDTNILLYTVDKFQGMEADIVFLSMVRGNSIGFMDNINRLNVALTRAKYQRVIVGDKSFFTEQRGSEELKKLAGNGEQH